MTRRVPAAAVQVPGLVSGVLIVLGAWLLVFSVTGVYGADSGFDAPWGDRIAGAAAVVTGVVRVSARIRLRTASGLAGAVGLWLVVSPFVLDYGFGADTATAITTDLLAGTALATLAAVELVGARITA
ncbi:SPW repeat protein [Actinokineospora guangxiensis]|uniref:SPW repeat protein n=1 Tax=Actinokineospora guangxiensis TaxID=1490288 RepID=A0ABW0EP83_9PSEU